MINEPPLIEAYKISESKNDKLFSFSQHELNDAHKRELFEIAFVLLQDTYGVSLNFFDRKQISEVVFIAEQYNVHGDQCTTVYNLCKSERQ